MLRKLALAAAATFMLASGALAATDFPTKPVTIIVPFAAGGPSDVFVRILADELQKVWHQPVLVDNKPGGGTVIGMNLVRHAAPDGYTLAQVAGAFTIQPSVRKPPYDTAKDFTPLSIFVTGPHAVVASKNFPADTMQQLMDLSKTKTLTFSSSGVGSGNHMAVELLESVTGAKWQHVPYNGDAEAMGDLLSGRIDFSEITWSSVRPQVDSGQLKLLAFDYPTRIPGYEKTPTLMELYPGMKDLPTGFWVGLVGPANIPADIVGKLDAGIKAAVTSDSFKKRITDIGSIPDYKSPAETAKLFASEMKAWAKLVKDRHIVVGQ